MTTKEIQLAATKKITNGQSRQDTFLELRHQGIKDRELATYINHIPSSLFRQNYKYVNLLLAVLLVLSAIIEMVVASRKPIAQGHYYYLLLFIFYPGIKLLGAFYLVTFKPYAHQMVFTGCIVLLSRKVIREWPIANTPYEIFDVVTCVILFALAIFLTQKVISRNCITKEKFVDDKGTSHLKLLVNLKD